MLGTPLCTPQISRIGRQRPNFHLGVFAAKQLGSATPSLGRLVKATNRKDTIREDLQGLYPLFRETLVYERDIWTSFVSGPLGLKLKIDVMELRAMNSGAPQMYRHRPTLGFASRTEHV